MNWFRAFVFLLLTAASLPRARAEDFQGSTHIFPFDEAPLNYTTATPHDRVAALQQKISAGTVKLKWDADFGWLPAVLEALGAPQSSQMLVFSRTSLQRREINPSNPRALYFGDDVYVGYIPDAPMMEVSAVDPDLGGVFYSLAQERWDGPKFVRNQDCMQCHGSGRSMGVPGHVLRSLHVAADGELETGTETSEVNQCTPLADRWGGWYVTGQHGKQTHLGNLFGQSAFQRQETEPNYRGNLTDLSEFFELEKYLTPRSDIVALMVLEHQTHMQNYITRLNYEARVMLDRYGHIRYLRSQVDAFLRYLLFVEEVPLTAPLRGDPQFVADFASTGPRDSKGRSLRELDMTTRMMKYPCSYLIYGEAFDRLPPVMRELLLERLYKILTGEDQSPQFARLTAADRGAILEILRETKPSLPAYWRDPAKLSVSTP